MLNWDVAQIGFAVDPISVRGCHCICFGSASTLFGKCQWGEHWNSSMLKQNCPFLSVPNRREARAAICEAGCGSRTRFRSKSSSVRPQIAVSDTRVYHLQLMILEHFRWWSLRWATYLEIPEHWKIKFFMTSVLFKNLIVLIYVKEI